MGQGCEWFCGHFGRASIFALTAGGIACAVVARGSCEFFSYTTDDASELPPPFTNQTEGFVGLFGTFQVNATEGKCDVYDDLFFDYSSAYFLTAQLSSIVAPSLIVVAFFINLIEWFCCKFTCCYVLAFCCLFLGAVIQGLTFLVYAESEFCFDDRADKDCKLEVGAILSITASGAFYVASVVWCCMPRLDPGYRKSKRQLEREMEEEQAQEKSREMEQAAPYEPDIQDDPTPNTSWQSMERSGSSGYGEPPLEQQYDDSAYSHQSTPTNGIGQEMVAHEPVGGHEEPFANPFVQEDVP